MTAHQLITGDQKVFTFKTNNFDGSVGFAVIETTDDDVIMCRYSELLTAMVADKESKGLSLLFLAVVNIVSLKSNLFLCGPNECSLAVKAFPSGKFTKKNAKHNVMDLGGLVSRKKDFIPALTHAINKGWRQVN